MTRSAELSGAGPRDATRGGVNHRALPGETGREGAPSRSIAALNRFAMAKQDMPWLVAMGNQTKQGEIADQPRGEEVGGFDRDIAAVIAAVHRRGDEMVALTRRWVEINSYTANVAGVNAVGARLREAFALPGLR